MTNVVSGCLTNQSIISISLNEVNFSSILKSKKFFKVGGTTPSYLVLCFQESQSCAATILLSDVKSKSNSKYLAPRL